MTRRELLAALIVGPLARVQVDTAAGGDLTALTIAEAADRIAAGAVSPIDLCAAYLSRIAQLNPRLNAFVTVTADRARSDARRAAATIADRRLTAEVSLRGIPIAHKDLFETSGIRTTAGSRLYDAYVPRKDAAIVARLAAAGTTMLGKTNTHELGGGVTTINPFYGVTRNPADPDRIAGGSSGGSAAAVAARLCAAATGSDTGGSVRIPAALCGCVGFKPTFGAVSTSGLLGACPTFDHVGWLTRTVEDAEILYNALVRSPRSTVRGPESATVHGPQSAKSLLQGLRVGVARRFFFDHLEPDIATAMDRAIDRFRTLGATVIDHNLPIDDQTMARAFDPIAAAEIWSRYGREWHARPDAFSPAFAEFFKTAAPDADNLTAARSARADLEAGVDLAFESVDLVLTPTVPMTAPRIDGPVDGARILRHTWPFNAARTPAISIPFGADASGLPIGLQLAARQHRDTVLLRWAHAFSRGLR